MGRLRMYNTNRYQSSAAVQSEFENIVRYINAAELGNLSLGELMAKLFDENGEVSLDIEFRYDAVTGLEVRVGDGDWVSVVQADDIRGAPGESIGFIDGPVFFNRQDFTAAANQQNFSYYIADDAVDLAVYKNGVLMAQADYTWSVPSQQVTLDTPVIAGTKITIFSIRNNASSTYRRTDLVSGANQVIFPFPHTEDEQVQVFRNGLLQREGATFDYTKSAITGTITMTVAQPADTLISIVVVDNSAVRSVGGIMLEDRYASDGLIQFNKIAIPDGAIQQGKVDGLPTALALKGDTYVSPTPPAGTIRAGSVWINTSTSVPSLLFYDGATWFSASPEGVLPALNPADALKFLRLNAAANAYELVTLDFSGLVRDDDVGNANGVAALDTNAKVPASQLPDTHRRALISQRIEGSITNATRNIALLAGGQFSIDAVTYMLDAGSCTIQLQIGGSNVGAPIAVGTTPVKQTWGAVAVNAAATGVPVAIVITGASGASGLTAALQGLITA